MTTEADRGLVRRDLGTQCTGGATDSACNRLESAALWPLCPFVLAIACDGDGAGKCSRMPVTKSSVVLVDGT